MFASPSAPWFDPSRPSSRSTASPGTVTYVANEDDGDIHLALQGADGSTLIAEAPEPACTVNARNRRADEASAADPGSTRPPRRCLDKARPAYAAGFPPGVEGSMG